MINDTYSNKRIFEIVNQHPGAIQVFEKFHVDFCCNGHLYFMEACLKAQANPDQVIEDLSKSKDGTMTPHVRVEEWSLDLLASYIVQNHHQYVRKNILEIHRLLIVVSRKHAFQHPELHKIKKQFAELSDELKVHMEKEENVLFPAVTLLSMKSASIAWDELNPLLTIELLEDDHEHVGEYLKKIRTLCKNFSPPVDACNSYRQLYQLLAQFEEDLHIHIHLENNLLFPKALELQAHLGAPMNNLN